MNTTEIQKTEWGPLPPLSYTWVRPCSAVRHRTAKTALPYEQTTKHVKDTAYGKGASERTAKNHARQRRLRTHGKESRTTKAPPNARQRHAARQREKPSHGKENYHGKGTPCAVMSCTAKEPLPCALPFAMRKIAFLFLFYSF
jgi:hypothetical protein